MAKDPLRVVREKKLTLLKSRYRKSSKRKNCGETQIFTKRQF